MVAGGKPNMIISAWSINTIFRARCSGPAVNHGAGSDNGNRMGRPHLACFGIVIVKNETVQRGRDRAVRFDDGKLRVQL
jgi:hypothetical protein